ncbi:MAG: hypothetical protein OXI67_00540 [Candidatus Poribacteria bacterium]|nr:hypothetical protein [Candidatus Poribacteria bacterium]
MQSHFDTPRVDEGTFRYSIKHELAELYEQTEETYTPDSEVDAISVTAYNDALFLLEFLYNSNVPMPNINRTKHGSLSLSWYPEEGTATLELCGDGLVVYNAFFDEDRKDEGVCVLTDIAALDELMGALRCVY